MENNIEQIKQRAVSGFKGELKKKVMETLGLAIKQQTKYRKLGDSIADLCCNEKIAAYREVLILIDKTN